MQFLSLHQLDQVYRHLPATRLNPLLTRESLRRLAWSVFFCDTLVDAGRHGAHLVTESSFHIQLPSSEDGFARGVEEITAYLQPPVVSDAIGLSGHLIRLAAFRRRVLHFNSRIKGSTVSHQDLFKSLSQFDIDLDHIASTISPSLAYNEGNLFAPSINRVSFVGFHMLRLNCYLMLALARIGVSEKADVDPTASRRTRVSHALEVVRVVEDVLRLNTTCDHFFVVQTYSSLESKPVSCDLT